MHKSHQKFISLPNGTKSGGLHCIYLLRHPVDTYFSTTNFQKTHTHKGKISPPDFHSSVGRQLWRYLVLDWSNYYYQTYTELSQNCRHGIKLVFYEDLVKNPWRLSKNLVTWIETVNEKVQQKENGTYLKENRDPILLRKKRSNFEILRQQRKTCFEMYSEGNFHRKHMPNERKFKVALDLLHSCIGLPTTGHLSSGHPSIGRLSIRWSSTGRPSTGRPSIRRSSTGGPSTGPLSSGYPSTGRSSNGRSSTGDLRSGVHLLGVPLPVVMTPFCQAPISQEPISQAPISKAPISQAPISQALISQAPISQAITNFFFESICFGEPPYSTV